MAKESRVDRDSDMSSAKADLLGLVRYIGNCIRPPKKSVQGGCLTRCLVIRKDRITGACIVNT